jgi:hypothetical protein
MQAHFTSLALAMALLGTLLMLPGSAVAQISPFLHQGIKELGLSGNLDFQQESRVVLNINGRFGYFPRNYLEVGGFAEVQSNFNEFSRYGLGGFAELHVPDWAILQGRAVPYAGADLGLAFVDTSLGDDNAALIFRPRVGLKWFIRDYFAIDTNLFVAVATDDLFPNRKITSIPTMSAYSSGSGCTSNKGQAGEAAVAMPLLPCERRGIFDL